MISSKLTPFKFSKEIAKSYIRFVPVNSHEVDVNSRMNETSTVCNDLMYVIGKNIYLYKKIFINSQIIHRQCSLYLLLRILDTC